MSSVPEISVVLPGFNERENIVTLVQQLKAALDFTGRSYEIIWVDDGSTDGSREVLLRTAAENISFQPIFHISNYGQSAALLTGFQVARGRLVVTMDSDLQNDPADLPAMIDRLEQDGVDAVCGIRRKRQDSRMKKISSRVANSVRHLALHDNITDAGCTMRVVRREALQQLPAFRALHRFLPTILQIHGYRISEMAVNHRARGAGVSKYGVGNRLWVGIFDIMGMSWYRRRYLPPNRTAE